MRIATKNTFWVGDFHPRMIGHRTRTSRGAPMMDNFRRRDISQPKGLQSPYSRLQEALTAAGAEPARPEALGTEAPDADLHAAAEPARPGRETGSKLIVGPDIKLKGAEITDCDTLVVEGRVEASMDSRAIQISEHGVFVGKAGIDVAEIRGRFEGELTARKQLVIRASGRVSGKIRYGKVAIEEGGELSGDVGALEAKGPAAVHAMADAERKGTASVAAPLPPPAPALPSKPAWTAQTGTQPQPSKPAAAAPQAGPQPQPSKPA